MWNLKSLNTETKSRLRVFRGWREGEMGRFWIKVTNFKLQISSGDLMYSMVIIVNNTVLYTCKLLRE